MNKKLSIGFIVTGILLLGFGGYLMYKRKKDSQSGKTGKEEGDKDTKTGEIKDGTKTDETATSGGSGTGSKDASSTSNTSTSTSTSGSTSGSVSASVENEVTSALKDAFVNVSFETGKSVLKSSSYPSLDELADVLKKTNWGLKLEGHTDSTGDANFNLTLSKKRAEAVKNYLIGKGIPASRISAEGFGSSKPIADNKTSDGRAKNRRVEFKIIK